jgi:membrane protein implicated in regulation of membrane protease activity
MQFDWYWLYFIIGIFFVLIEIFSLTFYFLPIGIAAISTGIFALFTNNLYIHVTVFCFIAILLFIFISKWKKSRFLKPIGSQHIAGLVGQQGIIVEAYKSPQDSGKVKVFSDVWDLFWDLHQQEKIMHLKEGDIVKVTAIEGNKVKVEKLN